MAGFASDAPLPKPGAGGTISYPEIPAPFKPGENFDAPHIALFMVGPATYEQIVDVFERTFAKYEITPKYIINHIVKNQRALVWFEDTKIVKRIFTTDDDEEEEKVIQLVSWTRTEEQMKILRESEKNATVEAYFVPVPGRFKMPEADSLYNVLIVSGIPRDMKTAELRALYSPFITGEKERITDGKRECTPFPIVTRTGQSDFAEVAFPRGRTDAIIAAQMRMFYTPSKGVTIKTFHKSSGKSATPAGRGVYAGDRFGRESRPWRRGGGRGY